MPPSSEAKRPLRVMVSGGGPVGLAFALTIKHLMGDGVWLEIFDERWTKTRDNRTVWRGIGEGNARREQVVTIQSRQYSQLPDFVQEALFQEPHFTGMAKACEMRIFSGMKL